MSGNDKNYWARRPSFWWEIIALALLVGVALFLRLWQLELVPRGFYYDEAIDLKLGLDVVAGARPIYVTEGWGREALYYYLVAAMLQIVPHNLLALRMTAVFCNTTVLFTAYFLVRKWNGRLAAWLTAAWLSLTYWPLSVSRFAVRNVTLPFVWGLAVLAFWWAWETPDTEVKRRSQRFLLAGFLAGLTLYTYQPARFTPFVFAAFVGYIILFHRHQWRTRWRGLVLMGVTAVVTILPLIIALTSNPATETGQRAFTIEPLTQLLAGDPHLVLENAAATAKVFTISGDPLESYNVPDRPIFAPAWTGLFFYAGLALALWRWRRPRYAFMLFWLVTALMPTVLTISAPNFNRIIAAQTPIMFMAALSMAEFSQWMMGKWAKAGVVVTAVIGLLIFVTTGVSTWHDYFTVWPAHPGTIEPLSRNIAAIALYLRDNPDDRPVIISSQHIEDTDPYILSASLDRDDLNRRWVDTGQTFAFPAGETNARLIVTTARWLDADLQAYWHEPGEPVYATEEFSVFDWRLPDIPSDGQEPLYFLPPGAPWPENNEPEVIGAPYPYAMCSCQSGPVGVADLLSLTVLADDLRPGDGVTAVSAWEVQQGGEPGSLSMFTHLLNADGELVGQQDGLGYPPHTWRPGDYFTQVHHIPTDASLPPGRYWLQIGFYWRETGQRWVLLDEDGEAMADRLLLPLTITE